MFDSFYTRISDIIDAHIPLIQLSKREFRMKSKPWITVSIDIKKNFLRNIFSLTLHIITLNSNFAKVFQTQHLLLHTEKKTNL